MNYYITKKRRDEENAGSKAPMDVNHICDSMGWQPCEVPVIRSKEGQIRRIKDLMANIRAWKKLLSKTGKGSVVLYQYPMSFGELIAEKYARKLNDKGVRTVILVHDIDHLRSAHPEEERVRRELSIIDSFAKVICHNSRMQAYLVSKGIAESKLVPLQIFDYLCESKQKDETARGERPSVAVAGNLDPKKCGYIYELARKNPDVDFHLYGRGYEDEGLENAQYKGSYPPEELPSQITADYGLVWDGDSAESCHGPMGAYLQYNNPHKLSLYLVSGIPVITWSRAAIADYIDEHHCGIALDSLGSLKSSLDRISDEEYRSMKEACGNIAGKLRNGDSFRNAINKACGDSSVVSDT